MLLAWNAFEARGEQQAETAAAKPFCEGNERFADFDFWVGEWKVYSNDEARTFQGKNSITRHHANCLLMENWTSASGTTGSSMNYYDAVEERWRQVWVSNGYAIDYGGGLDDAGAMVMEGSIYYYASGKRQPFRGNWAPNDDGSVRQLFEQQDVETGEWTVWFDGLYLRDEEAAAH
jgi:hypothetical protein